MCGDEFASTSAARRYCSVECHNKRRAGQQTTHGLTRRQRQWLREQHLRCAVCGDSDAVLAIDHDHATGALRGVLCRSCNLALGAVKDSPRRLRDLANYLEHADEITVPGQIRLAI